MSRLTKRPLLHASVGNHRLELWQASRYGDFQILHFVGSHLIPLHRCARTETRAREEFERAVERYAALGQSDLKGEAA
jgi:hypothetical protein